MAPETEERLCKCGCGHKLRSDNTSGWRGNAACVKKRRAAEKLEGKEPAPRLAKLAAPKKARRPKDLSGPAKELFGPACSGGCGKAEPGQEEALARLTDDELLGALEAAKEEVRRRIEGKTRLEKALAA